MFQIISFKEDGLANLALILDAATCAGTPRAMRRFLGKHQNAEPGSYNDRCVQRIKAALPYLDKLGWT